MENMQHTIGLEKLAQLEATLATLTGGSGTSELSDGQVNALLSLCRRLAFEALGSFAWGNEVFS